MLAKEFIKARPILSLGLLFASAFLLAACQATRSDLPKGMTEVMATWFQAIHSLPPSKVKIDPSKKADLIYMAARTSFSPDFKDPSWWKKVGARLKNPETKLPAVMYLHGCSGLSGNSDYYGELLGTEGYVVFMPDSFQRSREFCSDEGPLSHRVTLRHEEIKYALSRIQKIPWIDQNRIILMGHSEGGNATDNWAYGGFAAHIISGSACTLVGGMPAAPEGVPVLAMVGEKDQYRPGQSCTIKRTVGGSKSIVLPDAYHSISGYRETREAIKNFLKECCSKSNSKR